MPKTKKQQKEEQKAVKCQWFLKCANPATTTTPHPILGDVPTCKRCQEFATAK